MHQQGQRDGGTDCDEQRQPVAVPPAVQVKDEFGNPVPGAAVAEGGLKPNASVKVTADISTDSGQIDFSAPVLKAACGSTRSTTGAGRSAST